MDSYTLQPEIDPDVLKVADFIRYNVDPDKVHRVAEWVAELAPLIWPRTEKRAGELASAETPIKIFRSLR